MTTSDWIIAIGLMVLLYIPIYVFVDWLFSVVEGIIAAIIKAIKLHRDTRPLLDRLDSVRSEKTIADMEKCVLAMEEQVLKRKIQKCVANWDECWEDE